MPQTYHKEIPRPEVIKKLFFTTNPKLDRSALLVGKNDRVNGTCKWFLSDKSYEEWFKAVRMTSLLVSGPPGRAKHI